MTVGSSTSLKGRVLKAGSITVVGYIANQVLRFGSNLILTRLLFPEAFGIVAIMQAVVVGVTMLSDVGVSQSIIRSQRGAEPAFINTAWVIQIGKGLVMAFALWAAREPVASFYGQPMLSELMLVAALAAIVSGFNSTKLALADRNVDAVRVTLLEVGSLATGICASIVIASIYPSPWALVWGNLIAASTKMLLSHWVLRGPNNAFAWDKEAVGSIFSFGGWVLVSSALTYLAGEGNKLIAAALLDVRLLALLGIATTLNVVVWLAVTQMTGRVLFPAYAELLRNQPERFSAAVEKARRVQIAPAWVVALVFAFFGNVIVRLLYDHRYEGAGVILQIQAIGLMAATLSGSFGGVLWAMGRVSLSTWILALQVGLQIGAMALGHWVYGKAGVIVGLAASNWLLYPIHAFIYARLGLWHPKTDLPVLVASVLAAVFAAMFMDWTQLAGWH